MSCRKAPDGEGQLLRQLCTEVLVDVVLGKCSTEALVRMVVELMSVVRARVRWCPIMPNPLIDL
jgi:hypothetical protein